MAKSFQKEREAIKRKYEKKSILTLPLKYLSRWQALQHRFFIRMFSNKSVSFQIGFCDSSKYSFRTSHVPYREINNKKEIIILHRTVKNSIRYCSR